MTVQRAQAPSRPNRDMIHLIEKAKPKLALLATRYMGEERLCALALSMWNKDRRLRECDPTSFLLALFKACQYGLDPTGVGNQGHIIAYRGRAEFVRGWGGVITMAGRRGIRIDTFAVYESDEFEMVRQTTADGYFVGLHHKEIRDGDLGDVRAAYAIANCKDWDEPMIEVVWRHDIEKIRSASAAPNSPAWKAWYSEMARKTAVNRLAKRLPLFVEVKEFGTDDNVKKRLSSVAEIPNEDHFWEGRTGNNVIDASIDAKSNGGAEAPDGRMEMISAALALREEFPDIYRQVAGRKDITKMSEKELDGLVNEVRDIGQTASKDEAAPDIEWDEADELGF